MESLTDTPAVIAREKMSPDPRNKISSNSKSRTNGMELLPAKMADSIHSDKEAETLRKGVLLIL